MDLDEPTSLLDFVFLGCTQRECKPNETIIEYFSKMFESRISAGATDNLLVWQQPHAQAAAMGSDTVNWHTRKWSNFKKFHALAWMIINSSRKNSNQLENCQKVCSQIVQKCKNLARIGRLAGLRLVNKFARLITKWTQACDRRLARLLHSSRITRHSIADWVCVKTQTLLLRTQNQPQKLLSRTAPQSQRSFLWMMDYVWMGYLLSVFGTW